MSAWEPLGDKENNCCFTIASGGAKRRGAGAVPSKVPKYSVHAVTSDNAVEGRRSEKNTRQ
jgi:hypothetical protein